MNIERGFYYDHDISESGNSLGCVYYVNKLGVENEKYTNY